MKRPSPTEHDPFYSTYIDRVPDSAPVIATLAAAPDDLAATLAAVPGDRELDAYAPGKWSFREALGHVVDTERLFSFRALHMARGDTTPLPGMDQELWVAGSNAASRELADQLLEFRTLRTANVQLFSSFDDSVLDRRGTASGCEVTVRALIFIVAGHELHHRQIFAERYLPALADHA